MKSALLPLLLLATLSLLSTGCSNYLVIGVSGTKFREENAPFAGNALVGYKQSGNFHHRFVRQSKQPKYDTVTVRPVTVQHDTSSKKAAMKARIEAGQVASGGGSASSSAKVSGRYDIIEIADDLPSKLNERRNTQVLQDLAKWGGDARIVTAVAVAYDYRSTTDHDFSGNVTAAYNPYTGKLETHGSRRRTIILSDGTIFAYRMCKICWTRNQSGRLLVQEVVPDDPGSDMHCPNGSTDEPGSEPINSPR